METPFVYPKYMFKRFKNENYKKFLMFLPLSIDYYLIFLHAVKEGAKDSCLRSKALFSCYSTKMYITRQKRLLAIAVFVGLCVSTISADTISQRMGRFELSGLQYYSYYLSTWATAYTNYPFVVKVSVSILMLCAFSIGFLTFSLLRDKYVVQKHEHFYKKLKKKYYEKLYEVSNNPENLSITEVTNLIELTPEEKRKLKGWKMVYVGKLFVEVKSACYNTYNYHNIEQLVRVFGLQEFIENTLTFGSKSYRMQAMRMAQFLMVNVPESILVRLLDLRANTLHKEVRMYYLWLSDYSPFRFFTDKNINYEYRPWDALEIHHLLKARKKAHKEMPSLLPIVSLCNDKDLKACLIREVAYWGTHEEVMKMAKYISGRETSYREAAIQCMGIARCKEAEKLMEEAYPQQSEELKVETITAIQRIQSGKATPFLSKAYSDSTVTSTKFAILMCLWQYSEESKCIFVELENAATEENEALIFKEVRAFERYTASTSIAS